MSYVLRTIKTVYDYVAMYFLLALLGVICLSWSVIALLLFPLPRALGIAAGRFGIMAGFRVFTWFLSLFGAYRLDLRAIDALRGGPPVILAPNHPCLIDALLILTRHPNLACVMKGALMRNIFLGAGSRLARYIRSDMPRQMIKEAVADLRSGGVLLLFPEGTRTRRFPVGPLTASVGVIAKHARVPVQTLIIETDSSYLSKGWTLFRRPQLPITYRVRLGRRFDPPTDVGAFMTALEQEYSQQLSGSRVPARVSEASTAQAPGCAQ
jgi:1-acyl-sn-glycerol-3-phosphate acyltransferase